MKDKDSVFKSFICFKLKFKMKTSSRNISKLRVARQNMHLAEHLKMAAFDILIISTISNGCLETSLKLIHQEIKISEAATGYNLQEFLKLSKKNNNNNNMRDN